MFFKLLRNNVKRSMKDYSVYFLTIMLGVCLFYLFNSINSHTAALSLSSDVDNIVLFPQVLLNSVSVFVTIIWLFLITYANRFFIKRRKKELAVYMLLGMDKHKVSTILTLETVLTGLYALLYGLLAGIFASQGLMILIARLLDMKIAKYRFIFSGDAFIKAIVYFGIIFMIVMIFNGKAIRRYELIDLLNAAKKSETLKVKKMWIFVLIFILSAIALGIAYHYIPKESVMLINKLDIGGNYEGHIIILLVLVFAGTFLLFFSISGFLLKVIKANKKIYFRKLNMFILRQFNAKITTTFVTLSFLCFMLVVSIVFFATGSGYLKSIKEKYVISSAYDCSIIDYCENETTQRNTNYIWERLKQDDMKLEEIVSDYQLLHLYDTNIKLKHMMKYVNTKDPFNNLVFEKSKNSVVYIIPLSEFNHNLMLQEEEPITLGDNEYAIDFLGDIYSENFISYIKKHETLNINGKEFTPYPKLLKYSYKNELDFCALVLPDQEAEKGTLVQCIVNMQFKSSTEQACKIMEERSNEVYGKNNTPFKKWIIRTQLYDTMVGPFVKTYVVTLFISIVFLIASSAILALQQLSESADNIERYKLLRKIGVDEKEMHKSVMIQILLYFLLPLGLAISHSMVLLQIINKFIIAISSKYSLFPIFISSTAIIVLIYGGYILATYAGSKAIIRGK